MNQETLSLGLVGLATLHLTVLASRRWLTAVLSRFFLRRGRVKAAMWLRSQAEEACSDCE